MNPPTHRRPTLTVVIVVVVVVSASLAGILVERAGPSKPSPTTPGVRATTAFDFSSTLGLNLTLSTRPISVDQGRFLFLSASIFNSRPTPVLLEPNGTAMVVGPGPCSQVPLSVGISAGNYGLNNFSEASLGTIFYPGVFFCPAEFDIDRYSFAPQSGNV